MQFLLILLIGLLLSTFTLAQDLFGREGASVAIGLGVVGSVSWNILRTQRKNRNKDYHDEVFEPRGSAQVADTTETPETTTIDTPEITTTETPPVAEWPAPSSITVTSTVTSEIAPSLKTTIMSTVNKFVTHSPPPTTMTTFFVVAYDRRPHIADVVQIVGHTALYRNSEPGTTATASPYLPHTITGPVSQLEQEIRDLQEWWHSKIAPVAWLWDELTANPFEVRSNRFRIGLLLEWCVLQILYAAFNAIDAVRQTIDTKLAFLVPYFTVASAIWLTLAGSCLQHAWPLLKRAPRLIATYAPPTGRLLVAVIDAFIVFGVQRCVVVKDAYKDKDAELKAAREAKQQQQHTKLEQDKARRADAAVQTQLPAPSEPVRSSASSTQGTGAPRGLGTSPLRQDPFAYPFPPSWPQGTPTLERPVRNFGSSRTATGALTEPDQPTRPALRLTPRLTIRPTPQFELASNDPVSTNDPDQVGHRTRHHDHGHDDDGHQGRDNRHEERHADNAGSKAVEGEPAATPPTQLHQSPPEQPPSPSTLGERGEKEEPVQSDKMAAAIGEEVVAAGAEGVVAEKTEEEKEGEKEEEEEEETKGALPCEAEGHPSHPEVGLVDVAPPPVSQPIAPRSETDAMGPESSRPPSPSPMPDGDGDNADDAGDDGEDGGPPKGGAPVLAVSLEGPMEPSTVDAPPQAEESGPAPAAAPVDAGSVPGGPLAGRTLPSLAQRSILKPPTQRRRDGPREREPHPLKQVQFATEPTGEITTYTHVYDPQSRPMLYDSEMAVDSEGQQATPVATPEELSVDQRPAISGILQNLSADDLAAITPANYPAAEQGGQAPVQSSDELVAGTMEETIVARPQDEDGQIAQIAADLAQMDLSGYDFAALGQEAALDPGVWDAGSASGMLGTESPGLGLIGGDESPLNDNSTVDLMGPEMIDSQAWMDAYQPASASGAQDPEMPGLELGNGGESFLDDNLGDMTGLEMTDSQAWLEAYQPAGPQLSQEAPPTQDLMPLDPLPQVNWEGSAGSGGAAAPMEEVQIEVQQAPPPPPPQQQQQSQQQPQAEPQPQLSPPPPPPPPQAEPQPQSTTGRTTGTQTNPSERRILPLPRRRTNRVVANPGQGPSPFGHLGPLAPPSTPAPPVSPMPSNRDDQSSSDADSSSDESDGVSDDDSQTELQRVESDERLDLLMGNIDADSDSSESSDESDSSDDDDAEAQSNPEESGPWEAFAFADDDPDAPLLREMQQIMQRQQAQPYAVSRAAVQTNVPSGELSADEEELGRLLMDALEAEDSDISSTFEDDEAGESG